MRQATPAFVLLLLVTNIGCREQSQVIPTEAKRVKLDLSFERDLFPLVVPASLRHRFDDRMPGDAEALLAITKEGDGAEEKFQAKTTICRLLLEEGRKDEANTVFQELRMAEPPSSDLQLQRALLALRLGDLRFSAESAINSYKINPDSRALILIVLAAQGIREANGEADAVELLSHAKQAEAILVGNEPELAEKIGLSIDERM